MGVNPNDYKAVLVTNPDNRVVRTGTIDATSQKTQDLGRLAAKDIDVVNNENASAIRGGPTHVVRVSADMQFDVRSEFDVVEQMAAVGTTRAFTPLENVRLDQAFASIAQKTGVNENFIKTQFEEHRQTAVANTASLKMLAADKEKEFVAGINNKNMPWDQFDRVNQEIAQALAERAINGSLSPEDTKKLEDNFASFRQATGHSQSVVDDAVRDYLYNIDKAPSTYVTQQTAGDLDRVLDTIGRYVYSKTPEANITVAQFETTIVEGIKKPFPGNPNQRELLVLLHENVHPDHLIQSKDLEGNVVDKYNMPFVKNASPEVQELAAEIVSDLEGPIDFLDQAHRDGEIWAAPQREWLLQERMIDSFKIGKESRVHDSATFIRLKDQGFDLDLVKFDAEKQDLMKKIDARMGLNGRTGTADTMGAVQDLLKEDAANPEKKLLSPMQRAEAQSFLEDATALEFTANPNYVKAPKPDAAPEAPKPIASAPVPAWAQTPAA